MRRRAHGLYPEAGHRPRGDVDAYARVHGKPCAGTRVLIGKQKGQKQRQQSDMETDDNDAASALADMVFCAADRQHDALWDAVCLSLAALTASS